MLMKHYSISDFRKRERERGSALLTAVIFSSIVFTLMGSYLYLSTSEYRVSSRSYLMGASFNLAEGGLDRALHVLNTGDNSGWTTGADAESQTYWSKRFGRFDMGSNIDGYIRVVIVNPDSSAPEIYSEGEARGHVAGSVYKQLRASLNSGFYPFMNGFNSKRGVVLKGNNVTFDSYDSRNGNYGLGNINSEVTVATPSVESDSIDIGNADVYGYVATGAGEPDVGPKGSITTYSNTGVVDKSRITTDFYAEFPDVSVPTLISPSTSIPTSGSIMGGDYELSNWTMSGNNTLVITGDTRIVVDGDISIRGQAGVVVASGATVAIYVSGDADISGKGILNSSQVPSQLVILGTNTTAGAQSLNVSGNGYLSSAVYAPNAEVTLSGGGSVGRVYGAVSAYGAKLNGNSHFSYDEALDGYNLGGAGFQVDEWVELSGVGLTPLQIDMADYGL